MTPEELDAVRERLRGQRAPAIDLSGSDEDHAMRQEDGGVLRCTRCGAGRYLDRPGLLPKVCDQAGYRRRRMGL